MNKKRFKKVKYPMLVGAVLAACVCLALIFWYNKEFNSKYMDLMAETSMKDDTNSLSAEDRKSLREIMNTFFTDMGIRVSFHIATENPKPEKVGENTLKIAINEQTEEISYDFPLRLEKALGAERTYIKEQMTLNFDLCYKTLHKSLGQCMQENLVFAKNELYLKRAIVLKLR